MRAWLTTIDEPAVLVTVAIVEGSGPREPGAKMLVTRGRQFDTIGGGHLELCAVDLARAMLDDPSAGAARIERYALGPTLGQCCGGVVHLAFEVIDAALHDVLAALRARPREDSWRVAAIDGAPAALLYDAGGKVIAGAGEHGAAMPDFAAMADFAGRAGTRVVRDPAGHRWLIDACPAPRAHLLLFGAGHVGAAIVRLLGELPCTVTWIDEREDQFPATVPANVTVEATDTPETLVARAPAGASYLVLTHSHALDQRLSEAILSRAGVGWFGLIGSNTKRVQFERRLAARGMAPDRIAAMVCPIGLPGITSKLPAAIAASVCAQLLMVWEAQSHRIPDIQPLQF
ncbi:MAG: xanthine dehydrogenase accessory protein XdhC [Duganella sp.]